MRRCKDCDGPVSTKSTDRCRVCHGLAMKRRHRRKRAWRAQRFAQACKLARRVVKRMDRAAEQPIKNARDGRGRITGDGANRCIAEPAPLAQQGCGAPQRKGAR